MSLQAAFRSAQSALSTNAFQTTTVSRNVSGADVKGYVRKIVLVEPSSSGASNTTRVMRATDESLQRATLEASSSSQGLGVVAKALDSLQTIMGDPANETSPAGRISALNAALLQAASAPQNTAGLAAAVQAADSLATSLNQASSQVQDVRAQADSEMAASVSTINSLLKAFDSANRAILASRATGQDTSDLQDRRDAILGDLAKEVSISTVTGPNGDMSIYTDSGVALFQEMPRAVSMEPTSTFVAGTSGDAVYVDGVAITGPSATMPVRGGALFGLAEVRDRYTVVLQSQLDETAVGLINAFSQDASAAPMRTGLFAWTGGPALPVNGSPGIAASIRVDPIVRGDATLLRDGGIGGVGYISNSSGSASYSSGLYALVDALDAPQTFAAAALPARLNVSDLATQSQAWLVGARQTTLEKSTDANAVLTQTTAALTNVTGVSIDDQMSKMLDLENSYQAAAKMMAMVDSMYAALFSAVR